MHARTQADTQADTPSYAHKHTDTLALIEYKIHKQYFAKPLYIH